MPSLKKSKVKSSRRDLPAGLTVAAVALLALLLMSGPATASPITLDGIFDGLPPYSSSDTVQWFNGHGTLNSIYGDQSSPLYTTTIYYGVGTLMDGDPNVDYFFLYVDVPLYAKNMIWEDKGHHGWENDYTISNTDPNAGLTEADVSSYRVHHETHHDPGKMKLDFGGATGSEKLILNDSNGTEQFKADLAGNADNEFGLVGFKDSVDYLFDNGLATMGLSLARDTKMSFEFQFDLDTDQNDALLALFNNPIEFHLSPERGLSPVVPIPGAVYLLGSGLIGLAGIRRKFRK